MPVESYGLVDFRDAFSDVILQMRKECRRVCLASPATYEENAVNDSCRLAAVTLNEACRNDYDVVVNSYDYDGVHDVFRIGIFECSGTPYEISQLYFDGKSRAFSVADGNESASRPRPDYTLEFHPGCKIANNSRHTVSVMIQCVEFSFNIAGGHGPRASNFLDHTRNDVVMIDFRGRPGKFTWSC